MISRPLPISFFAVCLLAGPFLDNAAFAQGLQPVVRGSVKLKGQTVLEQRVEVVLLTSDGRPRDRVFTDSLGNFQFLNTAAGNYILVIDHPGYMRVEERVEITGTVSRNLTQRAFMLEPKSGTTTAPGGVVSAELLRMPKEAREAMQKGERELERRNYAKAAEHFEKAMELAPDSAEACSQRGVVALQQNEPTRARGFFQRAVAADGGHGGALIGLGAAFNREGDSQAAIEPLTKGLGQHPKSYLGLFERCRANLNLGQFESALADCEAAKQNGDGLRSELMVLQGNLFLRINRNAEALREFQNYLKQDSSSPTAQSVRDVVEKLRRAGVKAAS